jgi:subtilisin family serine protease
MNSKKRDFIYSLIIIFYLSLTKRLQMILNVRNIVLFSFTLALLFVFAVTAHGFKNEVAIIEQEVVDTLNDKGDVSVIIILREDIVSFPLVISEKKRRIKLKQSKVLSKLSQSDFKIKRKYKTISGIAGKIFPKGLMKLKKHPDVLRIYKDHKAFINLAQSIPLINADTVQNLGFSGTGVTVAVIDTGVEYTHSSLGGCLGSGCKVSGGYDFVNDDSNPMDDNGHGTHVAGIVASTHSTYTGVAPGANIAALKVLDSSGSGWFSDIAAAIDWCIDNKDFYNISVINMSLGNGGEYNNPAFCDQYLTANAIAEARNNGIITMVASGNDAHSDGISYPACGSAAVSVGGVYDANVGGVSWCGYPFCFPYLCTDSTTFADKVVCHTNSDEILDLMAPDYAIYSTALGGGFTTKGGTSMASPHAAGAAALLIEYNNLLTPDQIETILIDTGYDVTDTKNGLIFPRIDIQSALSGDSDYDGIKDDGDNSGIAGDNPCTGGATIGCDDNCIDTPNTNQDDADSDEVGDVCDVCPLSPPARITDVTSVYYSKFQDAYDDAGDGDVIQSQDIVFTENLLIDMNISVTLKGGYDCDYNDPPAGETTLIGTMTITETGGTITIESGTFEIR